MSLFKAFVRWGLFSLMWLPTANTQNTTGVHVQNKAFDQLLGRLLRFDVPVISVDSFYDKKDEYFILDTRSEEEYKEGHIQNAHFLNYDSPDFKLMKNIPHDKPILVYCSVGYRSEKIGRKLEDMGFSQVFNLYGSIFEWINKGHSIVNTNGQPTDSVHTYNRRWSQYVTNPNIKKTW